MVENLPSFYRSLIAKAKDLNGNNIFEHWEQEQIVEQAM